MLHAHKSWADPIPEPSMRTEPKQEDINWLYSLHGACLGYKGGWIPLSKSYIDNYAKDVPRHLFDRWPEQDGNVLCRVSEAGMRVIGVTASTL